MTNAGLRFNRDWLSGEKTRGNKMRKVAVYAGTRNLYEAMRVSVTSLLKNNELDSVFLLIEDDLFPYTMPAEVCAVNVSKQQFFPADGANANKGDKSFHKRKKKHFHKNNNQGSKPDNFSQSN